MKKNTAMWILMVLVAIWIVVIPNINNKITEPIKYHQGYEEIIDI